MVYIYSQEIILCKKKEAAADQLFDAEITWRDYFLMLCTYKKKIYIYIINMIGY